MALVTLSELIVSAQGGELVSFPTDTVPALAIRPDRAGVLFEVKERSQHKPLILMGDCVERFQPYWRGSAVEISIWYKVMQQHWPGPLTLVLPIEHPHGAIMNPQNPQNLGFRIPNHPQALEILRSTGPLATTSANRSGEAALTDPDRIAAAFPQGFVLKEPEPAGSGVASTVAQWSNHQWNILRSGADPLDLPAA
ncbi:MAG: Sua5/YciO/YrdC/YwlC family protein [Prochlorotrichaceae cyanobacterium]|jgi:L-threonylcarbamoyladenylate synthase